MSEIESKDFAEVADLLAPAEGTKEITMLGKKLQIKKITIGEIADIMKVAKDNELEQYIWMVYKGVVKPHLNVEQVRKMRHTEILSLAFEISKFSELDKESVRKLENLLNPKS